MERILVSMDAHHGAWEAWERAVSLAKRIEARVYALLVVPFPATPVSGRADKGALDVRKRLELLIELAQSEGIHIDYFISEGDYVEEVVRFADHNRITLLVAGSDDGESWLTGRGKLPIQRILHQVACRVELVSPRKIKPFSARKGNKHGYSTASVSADFRK